MSHDPLAIGLSGMSAAVTRFRASAHNVANLTTDEFRPLHARQEQVAGGGSQVSISRAPEAQGVDLAAETVEQIRARVQLEASARVIGTASDLTGQLVDLLA